MDKKPDNKDGIFRNCFIHVLPSNLGKKRLTLFQTQIRNQGGVHVDKLPGKKLTHVVVEDTVVADVTRCVKLLRGVDLDTVKVIGTQWLSQCLKERRCVDTHDFEMHPPENSNVQQKPVSPPELEISSKCIADTQDEEDRPKFSVEYSPPKKLKTVELEKYPCTQSSNKLGSRNNQNSLIISELQKLADAFRSSGDQWRSYGYEKAISAIRAYGSEIKTFEEAQSIPSVGAKMAAKICEILESGRLRKVDEICGNERTQAIELFTKVWGAGPATAQNWYQQGFRTLEDLRNKANLTNQQKIGLKHFDDIQDRMSREEVEEIASVVKKAALSIEPRLKIELCGSYRRGKETCGDVDVLIARPDDVGKDILTHLMALLKESGFITDDLVSMEENKTHKKYLGMCRLPGDNQKHRRLDIFVVPQSEYVLALMHYTGSALFNRSIRLLATHKGMSLSEHFLMGGVVREGKEILNDGYVIPTPTEESVFKHLDLEYRPPEERDH